MQAPRVHLVACGVFRREFQLLDPDLSSRFIPHFLDSMLHMKPEALDAALDGIVGKFGELPVVVLFGDCCPHMREICSRPGAVRVEGDNCVEIVLGKTRYRELKRARSFFFLPEWTDRWREIFEVRLGLGDPALARSFMKDEMTRLVYLDTGAAPVPRDELDRIAERFGLPVDVEAAGTAGLASVLRKALSSSASAGAEGGAEPAAVAAEGRAYDFLFSDLVQRILSLADTPARCVAYIAEELRQIVGARSIFIYESPGVTGREAPELVSVLPERRRRIGLSAGFVELASLAQSLDRPLIVSPSGEGELAGLLAASGAGNSLVLPLRYGSRAVGVALLLDLFELGNVASIIDTLGRLSSILALILRNGRLYENLEAAVRERTAELEAKQAELRASLREKEVMLKEIHHRVKNNLQVVNSLLYLRMAGIADPEVRRLFAESQSKIQAMALVHEEIYRSGDFGAVDLADYVQRLVARLGSLAPREISVRCETGPVSIGIDEAIPCGLILDELVLNAFKHAYAGREGGRLRVGLEPAPGGFVLEVEDDGPGIRPGTAGTESIGLSIVRSLTEQLKGRFEIVPGAGGFFRLTVLKGAS
jgi:two-component sensor histidine kinase